MDAVVRTGVETKKTIFYKSVAYADDIDQGSVIFATERESAKVDLLLNESKKKYIHSKNRTTTWVFDGDIQKVNQKLNYIYEHILRYDLVLISIEKH